MSELLEEGTLEQQPHVSVIIPVRDDPIRLTLCLEALSRQSYAAERTEILVVDNGSRRPLDELIGRFPRVRLLHEARRGSYAARNRGLSVARGDLVAFTDADCIPAAEWLAAGVQFFDDHPRCSLIAGRVEVFPASSEPSVAELYEMTVAFPQERYALDDGFAATANAWVRRSALERVPRFDDSLLSGGDAEFGSRIRAAGLEIGYSEAACVRHPARTLVELFVKQARIGRGMRAYHPVAHVSMRRRLRIIASMIFPFVHAAGVARRHKGKHRLRQAVLLFGLAVGVRYYRLLAYLRGGS